MLSADQVTAIAPDASSLKAGKDLATPRKWELLGGDSETLWGLATGSGKEPYQTRVCLADLASKCSCPSRKFPCKHAIALMLVAANQPAELTAKERPPWLVEWIDSRAARQEKKQEKSNAVPDEAAAAKRREKRENRIDEGISLLRQTLIDLLREGLATTSARDPKTWENLHRRMTDCQAPGLAASIRSIAEDLLHASDDEWLAWEIARLFLIIESYGRRESLDEPARAEIASCIGDGPATADVLATPTVDDEWFVASREITCRDQLVTSLTWLFGMRTGRWAKTLKFAHAPSTVTEAWPPGSTIRTSFHFYPGLHPSRALAGNDGTVVPGIHPAPSDENFDALLDRHAAILATNPFHRTTPFLTEIHPSGKTLTDASNRTLPWSTPEATAFRVQCIAAGKPSLACGEWDGRGIRLLAIADGNHWHPLTLQRA